MTMLRCTNRTVGNNDGGASDLCCNHWWRTAVCASLLLVLTFAWPAPGHTAYISLQLSGSTNSAASSVAKTISKSDKFDYPGSGSFSRNIVDYASDPLGADIFVEAGATAGELGAVVTVSKPPPLVMGPVTFLNQANGSAQAYYLDVITPWHPSNASIDIHVRTILHGDVSPGQSYTFARGSLKTEIWLFTNIMYSYEQVNDGRGPQPRAFIVDEVFTIPSGARIVVTQRLRAEAQATSESSVGDAYADLGSTGRLYIDVLTPGGTIVAESGHAYATPVSEPTTIAFMLAGFGLVNCAARRRRRT